MFENSKSGLEEGPLDFGAHVRFDIEKTEAESGSGTLADFGLHEVVRSVDAFAEWYEEAGYGGAVLSQPPYMSDANADRAAKANDLLIEELEGHENMYGLAAIPTEAGGGVAAEEFERCLEAGYNGGALAVRPDHEALRPETDYIDLHDEAMEPVLEVADDTGAPILVHPKYSDDSFPDWAMADENQVFSIFGRESALAISICKVIHGGVLDRYPNLNLVYHHFGGNIGSMLGRIHLRLDADRWTVDDDTKPFPEFYATLEERIYVDTSGFFGYPTPARAALETFPSSNILFGTDAPFEPRTVEELREVAETIEDLTAGEDARRIFGGNARELLVNAD